MYNNSFENRFTNTNVMRRNNFDRDFSTVKKAWKGGHYFPEKKQNKNKQKNKQTNKQKTQNQHPMSRKAYFKSKHLNQDNNFFRNSKYCNYECTFRKICRFSFVNDVLNTFSLASTAVKAFLWAPTDLAQCVTWLSRNRYNPFPSYLGFIRPALDTYVRPSSIRDTALKPI